MRFGQSITSRGEVKTWKEDDISRKMCLKLNNGLLFECCLFVGWMPEPTRQNQTTKKMESIFGRLCFGFKNHAGFGNRREGIKAKSSPDVSQKV